ncbi:MAG: DUF1926 domain-containing protein [Chloroflexi bacterium]|nr:DUF1926 domain-containing protein [Chloroflexota bacterium]
MKRLFLGLALHSHQPVGNFPSVFAEAYEKAYLPLVAALERHPTIRLSLHYSGSLLDWLREHRPDFIKRVAALAARGQVELMGGAYYEPILPIIPDRDKEGQIREMQEVVARDFGVPAQGLWLAERVWEPHLPKALAQAGVPWTVVDDTHFKLAGLEEQELCGYFLTEEEGYTVKVFPSSKALRYHLPWHEVPAVMAYLQSLASEEVGAIAVMGDDDEKFGSWPRTFRHCWEEGWVESFFQALEANAAWLTTIPLGEYAARFPARGRVYLPNASYDEMLEWALPASQGQRLHQLKERLAQEGRQDLLPHLRGGFWRHFLVKYPESNAMHKKMLRVHHKVYAALERGPGRDQEGLRDLWRGQCNCPYWHGVFGGLYLSDVRTANYRHLLRAESWADAHLHPQAGWLSVSHEDYDGDGDREVLVEGHSQNLYLAPHLGGGLVEWDLRQAAHNLASTVARRPEAYHALLARPQGDGEGVVRARVKSIHDGLAMKDGAPPPVPVYDRQRRLCLLERFLSPGTTLEQFGRGQHEDLGDFAGGGFQAESEQEGAAQVIRLRREGKVAGKGLLLEKSLRLQPGSESLEVAYLLRNDGPAPIETVFGSEWNLNLLGGGRNPFAYFVIPGGQVKDPRLDAWEEQREVAELALGNRGLGVELRLRLSPPGRAWRFPVNALSSSEEGVEEVYQGTCLLLAWPLALGPGEEAHFRLDWA